MILQEIGIHFRQEVELASLFTDAGAAAAKVFDEFLDRGILRRDPRASCPGWKEGIRPVLVSG